MEPLYSGRPWGTTFWPLGVVFIVLYTSVHLGPGCLAVISQLAYSGVVFKRGSTAVASWQPATSWADLAGHG